MKRLRRSRGWIGLCLVAVLCHFGLHAGEASAFVLCFGADGHVAVEPAHDQRSEARPKRERAPDAKAAAFAATGECSPCLNLPLVSEDHGAHKPLVAQKPGSLDVKAAPEAVIAFVSFDRTFPPLWCPDPPIGDPRLPALRSIVLLI